ncbi:MAG: tetratricopeptide repeat protein [Bacteroidales bacterium]|nr:tetratricopeptide repeat protein [Bacteroidales bacterium]
MKPNSSQNLPLKITIISAIIVFTIITYSNHFNNPFHFDDAHTIENNMYIKSLKNFPLFFSDASTISSNPMNQNYRPLITLSNAFDYYLGGGLDPFYFHLSMFFWFIVQIIIMFLMFSKLANLTGTHKYNIYFVGFAVAWYAIHTANAETLNYIISRTDSLSTLCVVASMYMYISFPLKRKSFAYLLPVILGMFIKEQTAMFVPILFFYILLFENKMPLSDIFVKSKFPLLRNSIIRTMPALFILGLLSVFVIRMQPDSFSPGGISAFDYFITQPWVYLRYFICFFLPFNLSADTDWDAISNIFDERVIVGFSFIAFLIYWAFRSSKNKETRAVSWGILWFLFALLPTSSFIPLAEVTNDHRMFFPFVGLTLSIVWTIRYWLIKKDEKFLTKNVISRYIITGVCLIIIMANAYGVRQRNKVWSSSESLWYDVSIKSPRNGRGLMNYGLALMSKGDLNGALEVYNKALVLTPSYSYLHINMGIVKNSLGLKEEAESHFKLAVQYGGSYSEPNYYYANFLYANNRITEAQHYAETALSLAPAHVSSRHLLLNIYKVLNLKDKLNALIEESLRINPEDTYVMQFKQIGESDQPLEIALAEQQALNEPTPENYLNLSLIYYNHSRFNECIEACNSALNLRPNYAEAYNNICSAHNAMGEWDKGIEACEKALSIKPDYQLARNNLRYAQSQKQ